MPQRTPRLSSSCSSFRISAVSFLPIVVVIFSHATRRRISKSYQRLGVRVCVLVCVCVYSCVKTLACILPAIYQSQQFSSESSLHCDKVKVPLPFPLLPCPILWLPLCACCCSWLQLQLLANLAPLLPFVTSPVNCLSFCEADKANSSRV